jgi:hypothetical protein
MAMSRLMGKTIASAKTSMSWHGNANANADAKETCQSGQRCDVARCLVTSRFLDRWSVTVPVTYAAQETVQEPVYEPYEATETVWDTVPDGFRTEFVDEIVHEPVYGQRRKLCACSAGGKHCLKQCACDRRSKATRAWHALTACCS